MKKIGLFVIAIMIAMVSVTSAVSVDIVHKDTTTWNEIDSAGLLEYTMPCSGSEMTYNFTIVEPSNMTPDTDYCLLFYTRNAENVSWNNTANEVWNHQGSKIIKCATTDNTGYFVPMTGTFNFSLYGTGLDNINDGDDYDGSVEGAKVWLVPRTDITEGTVDAVTGWGNLEMFLFETELVACADNRTQTVDVVVSCPVSFDVLPTNYNYGTIYPGACSVKNPDSGQKVILNNTGCPDLQVEINTTGIFENIDYDVDGDGSLTWIDANNLSINVDRGSTKNLNTRICIPIGTVPDSYTGTVTFEYIAVSP